MIFIDEHLRSIHASETYELRHQVLRPNQPLKACIYPFDDHIASYHVGYYDNDRLIGIGSIFHEPLNSDMGDSGWRIRGMAVSKEAQGKGVGGKILETLVAYVTAKAQYAEIWCNGRLAVQGFYERYGFTRQGDTFEVPDIGPHVLMIKRISK